MTVITMEIRMQGEVQGCKETVAAELERILLPIGPARVRCLSAVVKPEGEQLRMDGGWGNGLPRAAGPLSQ